MCFTKTSWDDTAKVAEQDIEVFKILRTSRISPVFGEFTWEKDKLVESEMVDYTDTIEEGLHSIKTLDNAQRYREWELGDIEDYPIFNCIIPKGATYWENETQYVSNQLILKSETPIEEPIEVSEN